MTMSVRVLRNSFAAAALCALCLPARGAEAPLRQASFHVRNLFTVAVPKGAQSVRVWFAVPQEDDQSAVTHLEVNAGGAPVRYETDSQGNRVGYVQLSAPAKEAVEIREEFDLTRTETRTHPDAAATRPLSDKERAALARYLTPTTYVIVNDKIKQLSATIVAGEQNPVLAARRLYDWTLKNVDYWVKDPEHLKASPVGSTDYCLTTRTGNCTDFHSLFASLAIAAGLPVRMVYGSLLKPTLNGVQVDGSYHCWIQFYAPRLGWIPLDASLANIYGKEFPLTEANQKLVELTTATGYKGLDASKVDYYFGNLDERRVVWSSGRDLMMEPPQEDGPVNSLAKAHVEVDGKASTDWKRVLTYQEK
jgi:transglutaminase-like putative cysteine protease